ncbi:nucleotidyltransferase family protein [Bacillus haikouensis]|uniref:nucleotidyltransferase family protein n=1 Tax=Bacillus haikouensis TaxID=1510468 RepID=UPI0015554AD7|nr:nucleotidyltransferase family protein [Bacillus haikouensis]NQD65955.1 nucleotidyltransferase family protein [Bacillus haikouensis]
MKTEDDIIQLIKNDEWMMKILKAAQALNLPDCWVCAGFIRTKVWDTLQGNKLRSKLADIDVVYFDPDNILEEKEKEYEQILHTLIPEEPWSVKNQARMHVINGEEPYTSTIDAVSRFPETATSIAVKHSDGNDADIILASPWGVDDLLTMHIRATPSFIQKKELSNIYNERIHRKKWKDNWPMVEVHSLNPSR